MLRIALAGVGLGCVAALGACQPSMPVPSDADVARLASDVYVSIGDVPLVLPLTALPNYTSMGQSFSLDRSRDKKEWIERRNEFRKLASNPATAPSLNNLEVVIDNYGGHGWDAICPALKREWARSVCDAPWAPLAQALPPNRFDLADDRNIDAFDHHWTVGDARVSDQLRMMDLGADEASVVCDSEVVGTTRFCTAAIRLEQHLIAVWTVWEGENETSAQQATREGQAIAAFVSHALGPQENFPDLIEQACRLRRPGSEPFPGKPYPCAT